MIIHLTSDAGWRHGRLVIQMLPLCSVMLKINRPVPTDTPIQFGFPMVVSSRRAAWKWRTGNAAPTGLW